MNASRRRTRFKILTVAILSMFILSGIPILDQAEESDAATAPAWGSGFQYCYTVTLDNDDQYIRSYIYNTKTTTTLNSSNQISDNYTSSGYWKWSSSTGYGPFNSYYGVFNSSNGTFMGVLNPLNFNQYIKRTDGNTSLDATNDIKNHNVMWILPKVYIYSPSTNTIVITNMSNAGAYNVTMSNNNARAHYVGGVSYPAIGIAVYEMTFSGCNYSSSGTTSDTTKRIQSVSGLNASKWDADTFAHARTMVMNTVFKDGVNSASTQGMFWNAYQYVTLTMLVEAIGAKPGSNTVGTTGNYNSTTYGYSSNDKVFIERPHSLGHIDDVSLLVSGSNINMYAGQNSVSNITDESSSGKTNLGVVGRTGTIPMPVGNGTRPVIWIYGGLSKLPSPYNYSYVSSATAVPWASTWPICMYSTGYVEEEDEEEGYYEDWYADMFAATGSVSNLSRMVALFKAEPKASYTISAFSSNTSYGTVSPASYAIPEGSSITVSGNTIKYNNTTIITASAKSATAQYTYAFSKWQYLNGSTWTDLTGTKTISANTSIKAVFTATVNTYQVKYYNGSSQITSYTENVQYNGHITHASYSVSGKVFCGWYKNSSSFTSANLVTTSTAVTGALTLYAYMVDVLAFTTSPVVNATITYASDMGCVLFDALKSESAARVLWDFGDGTYGDEVVMYHHYEEPGTYNVLLTVYNYDGEMDSKGYVVAVYDMESPPQSNNDTLLIVGGIVAIVIAGFIIFRPF